MYFIFAGSNHVMVRSRPVFTNQYNDRTSKIINQCGCPPFVIGQLFFTVILSFIGFGVLAFAYAILYKMAGPPRYGPFDIPPNVR
jgi:hypothetical protein